MRKIINNQMKFGQVDISKIEFDPRSRDEIPKLLMGLQYIFCNSEIRKKVFDVLVRIIPPNIDKNFGREGMDLWHILVLGTIRLNCNWDFDKIKEMADNHLTIRQMLGHGIFDTDVKYPLQTIRDNVSLLTPEVLDDINQIVVKSGHTLLKKNSEEEIRVKVDSFVVETDVHYPTDINLLWDAVRKVATLTARVCDNVKLPGWRNWESNLKRVKKLFLRVQNLKRSKSKNPKVIEAKDIKIKKAHKKYIVKAEALLLKAVTDIKAIKSRGLIDNDSYIEIIRYFAHGERQISQIERRVFKGEKIPHTEKMFSLFQEHTEWISKGKAGILVELGLNVCVCEDNYGFILHYKIMEKVTDEKIALPIMNEVKEKYDRIKGCSFDTGFYTPKNLEELRKMFEVVILPKRGKLTTAEREYINTEEYVNGRRQHAAIESAINALENHGLDKCRDHGIDGFKRYVSLAIVSRNLQKIGHFLQQKELERVKREERSRRKYRPAA